MEILPADLEDARVRALIAEHLDGMHATSPPGHVFALDLSGLQGSDISLFAVWSRDELAGIGALREIGDGSGELKSMRTARTHLRQGVAARLLNYLIALAKTRGLHRLSLETGRGAAFQPAIALYERHGFVQGGPFADYSDGAFSQFYHLEL